MTTDTQVRQWTSTTLPPVNLRVGLVREVKSLEYLDNLNDILADSDSVDTESIQRTQDLLNKMQDSVVGRLHRMQSQYSVRHLTKIKSAVDEIVDSYSNDFDKLLQQLGPKSYDVGLQTVDSIVGLVGLNAPLSVITKTDVKIAAKIKPALIKGYSDYAKSKIGLYINSSSLTGVSVSEMIGTLSKSIDTRGTPFHSVAYRAEVIARTENSRIKAYSIDARMQQFVKEYPSFGMSQQMVLATTPNGPCELCMDEFDSAPDGDGVWPVGSEAAPELPRHPCCFCNLVPYFAGLSTKSKSPRTIDSDLADAIGNDDEES